jgi:hypothetical protein
VAYGYRFSEFKAPILAENIKSDVKFVIKEWSDTDRRPPMCVSLGCHLNSFKMPFGDLSDTASSIAGVLKRTAFKHPPADSHLRSELAEFVRCWLQKNLCPLNVVDDVSFDTWLEGTKYSRARKDQLKRTFESFDGTLSKRDKECKSFNKAESYSAWKHLRGINSRSDIFKCIVGPTFSAIEKVLFKMKWFIKKVPVSHRARHVWEAMYSPTAQYYATDYSAFESHFDSQLMAEVEFQLYEYMTAALPTGASWFQLVSETLGGLQTCHYKGFDATGVASRMSGEMCTSLGNSFANLMIFLYVCSKAGIVEEDISGFVEGDDGLFRFQKHQVIDDSLFTKLGLTIKIEKYDTLNEASFCGLIFDPDSLIIITDPREVLADFGWAGPSYVRCGSVRRNELLRAKSLSFLHQYPGCPIVQALAQYGLRVTNHVSLTRFLERGYQLNAWEREQLMDAIENVDKVVARPVTRRSREIVEKMYGISPVEQERIEAQLWALGEKRVKQPIDLGQPTYMPDAWADCWFEYVRPSQGDFPVAYSSRLVHNNLPNIADRILSRDPIVGADFHSRLWTR